MNTGELVKEGRAWVFAEDNINTDLIMPSTAFKAPLDEQIKMIFSANRPGWVDMVQAGDILVGGKNFGTGSSRPGAHLFAMLGIGALVAESINGIFYRNCVNYALPAMECPGITEAVQEGDIVRADISEGVVENRSSQKRLEGERMPEFLLEIVKTGGLLEQLKREEYIS